MEKPVTVALENIDLIREKEKKEGEKKKKEHVGSIKPGMSSEDRVVRFWVSGDA